MDKFLMENGFIPYKNHNNQLYHVIEQESKSFAKRITGNDYSNFIVKSKRVNAYRVKYKDVPIIIVTDQLLLKIQRTAHEILNHKVVNKFFKKEIGYKYSPRDTGIPFWHGSNPPDQFLHNKFYTYFSLLLGVTKGAAIFILIHEIGHDLPENAFVNINLPFLINTTYGEVQREYSADMYAVELALERFYLLISSSESKRQIHNLLFNFFQSFLSGLVAIAISSEINTDHPQRAVRFELLHGSYRNFLLLGSPFNFTVEEGALFHQIFYAFGRIILPILHKFGGSDVRVVSL